MEGNVSDKINDLEKRVAALEKIEHRRKVKNIIIFILYSIVVIAMIVGMIIMYNKLKPYKEKFDSMSNILNVGENSSYSLDDYTSLFNDLLK